MSTHPCERWLDGAAVKSHPSTSILEVNLYTPGIAEESGSGRNVYENSAVDELTGFCHYLEFPSTENLLTLAELSVLLEGNVVDVTAILDGIEPEFRAMAEFKIGFTQTVTDPYAHEGTDDIDATGWFNDVDITDESEDTPWQAP